MKLQTLLFSVLAIILLVVGLSAFQSPVVATSHCWTVTEDVAPVDDPSTPAVENETTTPDGTHVKNKGKKGDATVKVKYCDGCETHAAHTDVDANGAGSNVTVTVAGNGSTVNIDAGTGPKAGARTSLSGNKNTVTLKGSKNCWADGGKGNKVNAPTSGTGNHSHSYPLPPAHP